MSVKRDRAGRWVGGSCVLAMALAAGEPRAWGVDDAAPPAAVVDVLGAAEEATQAESLDVLGFLPAGLKRTRGEFRVVRVEGPVGLWEAAQAEDEEEDEDEEDEDDEDDEDEDEDDEDDDEDEDEDEEGDDEEGDEDDRLRVGGAEWRQVFVGSTVLRDRWRVIAPDAAAAATTSATASGRGKPAFVHRGVYELRTGTGAYVVLEASDGTQVHVDRLSRVRLARLGPTGDGAGAKPAGGAAGVGGPVLVEVMRGRVRVMPAAGRSAMVVTPKGADLLSEATQVSLDPFRGAVLNRLSVARSTP